ncbi:MAG: hypothetical protein ACI8RD_002624, partial [Bacillariaceae sp.]|jgi:hypothetical protein
VTIRLLLISIRRSRRRRRRRRIVVIVIVVVVFLLFDRDRTTSIVIAIGGSCRLPSSCLAEHLNPEFSQVKLNWDNIREGMIKQYTPHS